MDIPFINLKEQWALERAEVLPIIDKVISTGILVGGPNVKAFEEKVSSYCNVKYCVTLNSGTDALLCALFALGIGRGDEVITPPNSFIASTGAIVHIGAKPVFVDVTDDQTIDVQRIETAITKKTRAIMPVHLTGRMADMVSINKIARKYNLKVLEDCAQAIGSSSLNKLSGSLGDIGCFSCHPLKTLNACGDGGFITTNEKSYADRIREFRNHGLIDRNTVQRFGTVSRMDELQAAILSYRIDKLPNIIRKRSENAEKYRELINKKNVFIPEEPLHTTNSYHTFVIQCEKREQLKKYLERKGVQTAIHYPIPIHLQPAAKNFGYKIGDFPVCERQAKKILTLPINQFLSNESIEKVSVEINNFFGG